jgi:hypothetical protein
MRKAPFPSKLGIITVLVLSSASFDHLGTSHLFHLFRSSPSKLFSRFRSRRREEAQEQTESRNQSKLPPITPPLEELESFHWTLLGMYLCIVGGLCLLIAVHVHIHRPLPHER